MNSEIVTYESNPDSHNEWGILTAILKNHATNWPIVYTLDNDRQIYIGETGSALRRLSEHSKNKDKSKLARAHIVHNTQFNKSASLDLESLLIQMFAADNKYDVINATGGLINGDYYDRQRYNDEFRKIFEQFRDLGMFNHTWDSIRNSDLFKWSPFKALTEDQHIAVGQMVEGILASIRSNAQTESVVSGGPGTGKTIVAVHVLKLLVDIAERRRPLKDDESWDFSKFFTEENADLLEGFTFGFVIPQQSLRETMGKVFKATLGLNKAMLVSPFKVGSGKEFYDLLIVDEAHRLGVRAPQANGSLNNRFADNNKNLFGSDDVRFTQLDWIRKRSNHRILMLDSGQSIRPSDLDNPLIEDIVATAKKSNNFYPLRTQMRVKAGSDYEKFIREMLSGVATDIPDFGDYDFRFFDSIEAMEAQVRKRDATGGFARLVAGYAWPWQSKRDPSKFDIEIGGRSYHWNQTDKDWINSSNSIDEVGSIHTTQGYDLNYTGVIIGQDLRMDPRTKEVFFDKSHYFDRGGMKMPTRAKETGEKADFLSFVQNIYTVLLTRGINGTYLYVCDPTLRDYVAGLFAKRSTA
ncbi:DUF2075 domain-containing protein [Brevibacterium sp. Marseille-P9724]|uniref:DUF2075 domain-containing protein n=1 Tax=Brevibacterium sp. Marseille-P9724 TaxID=2614125 RepID=UPI00125F5682|nr:DUF2075 domain-containing protein [Brevibacterium sp. Marseille-P9724]